MSQTYNETMCTPAALQQTAAYLEREWPAIEQFLRGKQKFVFLGCGSSLSLARSMAVMTRMHTGLPADVLAAGDLLLHAPRYARSLRDAVVVCVSRSGHTSEMLMALDAIQPFSITPAALVSADNTPLEARCEMTLRMPWAFDNSVCQTRTVTNFYFAAAYVLAKMTDNQELIADLRHVTEHCGDFQAAAERLAEDIAARPWTHCAVLADAELEGIADEGALIFKEVCQLPSNYYHTLDTRHGPMVLFHEHTLLLVALGPENNLELDFLAEMREKGAQVVALSDMPIQTPDVVNLSYGRELTHIARGLPFIMLCQMVALHKAAHTGADPDKPTGLHAWIALDPKEP